LLLKKGRHTVAPLGRAVNMKVQRTREDEDRIAFGDVLTTIHCLVRAERERLCPRSASLSFDR